MRPRPDTFYGVAKVAAEALLSLYADRHGIDAVALRIGSLPAAAGDPSGGCPRGCRPATRSGWCDAALTAPDPGFAVVYGVSANTRGWWDLGPGRALGYEPEDDAEDHADRVPARDEDEDEASHVGGPFATDLFRRPSR